MYVRDAKNREEVWLLDHIEEMGLDETAFRSRDYVIAIDEESNEKTGFGRIRLHKTGTETERSPSGQGTGGEICELTSIGVLEQWRQQGVGAHIIERLVETAAEGFETVYTLTDESDYLAQFGFNAIDEDDLPEVLQQRLEEKRESVLPEAVPMQIDTDMFEMPPRLRERFKYAAEQTENDIEQEATAEDFGIDDESATYKYDTG
jgi:N-acetylglutamate synthase-like GNAT family acetyltransferase